MNINKYISPKQARIDWSRFSHSQIRCIDALDFAVPMHETYLREKFNVRGNTIYSLIASTHIRRFYLADPTEAASMGSPFLTLTQQGEAVQRDWRMWNDDVKRKLANVYGAKP